MSWFTGDDGKRYELFGAGGGQELADELGVPLLGAAAAGAGPAGGRRLRPPDHRRRSRQRGRGQLPRAWPSASPSSWRPARSSAPSCASADRRCPAHGTRRAVSRLTSRRPRPRSLPVDVRIGITQAARELLVELADDTDRDALKGTISRRPGRSGGHPGAHRPPRPRGARPVGEDRLRRGGRGRRRAADGLRRLTEAAAAVTVAGPGDLIEHRLLFVTGKGGVGKTTIAAALAVARRGRGASGCWSARSTPRAPWRRRSRPGRCASSRGRCTPASRRWP